MADIRITLFQTAMAWHAPATNRHFLEESLQDLAGKTDLIVLPEMFTTGFSMDTAQAEVHNTHTSRWLQMQADRLKAGIIGSVMTQDQGHFYNRLYIALPGQPMQWYNKRHLFRMAQEHQHYTAGQERLVVEYMGWRICPLVCYDLRFPVYSRNAPVAYDVVVYIANWPAKRALAWNTLLPARAIENLCYSVGVNRVGTDGNGHPYQGDSQAISYNGQVLKHLGPEAGHATVSLSLAELATYRQDFPAWQDADLFTVSYL